MADLPLDQAVARFHENEKRINQFVNDTEGAGEYETSSGEKVPALPVMLPQVLTASIQVANDANRAENAAGAAFVNADLYTDIASGLAQTSENDQFLVLDPDGLRYTRYKHEVVEGSPAAAPLPAGYPTPASVNSQALRIDGIREQLGGAPSDLAVTIEDDQGRIAAQFDEDGGMHVASILADEISTPHLGFERPSSRFAASVSDESGGEAGGFDTSGTFHTPALQTNSINGMDISVLSGHALAVFAANRWGCGNEGQSNAAGQPDAVHTAQVFDAVGFAPHAIDPTSFLPMTAANCADGNREPPGFGAIDYMKQLIDSELGIDYLTNEFQPVFMNTAYGGTAIAQLTTGTASFDEYVSMVQAAFDLSQAEGKTFIQLVNFWNQGEGNFRDSWQAYYSQFLTYHEGRNAAAKAITGQSEPVYTVASQMNSSGKNYSQSVALAVLKASEDHPHIVCACPTYFRNFIDDVHGSGTSLDIEGAYKGLAAFLTIITRRKFQPLKAVSSRLQGRVQEVTFNKAGLVLATSATVPGIPQYGFQMVTPAGTEIPLESATVTGPSTVRFVWASAPPPGSIWWAGGKRIEAGLKGAYIGSCINLRDNQGEQYQYKAMPLHNWCVVHNIDPRGN